MGEVLLNSGQSLPSFSTVLACHNLGESTDKLIGKMEIRPTRRERTVATIASSILNLLGVK